MYRKKEHGNISLAKILTTTFRLSPPRAIVSSFALMILIGTFLLNLPAASAVGESPGFIDSLFTATSASCVIGMTVVNTASYWSPFGKTVIFLLCQLGALGIMAFLSIAMIMAKRQLTLSDRMIIQASFNQESIGGMAKLLKFIFTATLAIEAVGAVFLTAAFYFTDGQSFINSLVMGVFHSVSAFCNAGFDLLGSGSLASYRSNPAVTAPITLLFLLGGLGFVVLKELWEVTVNKKKKSLRIRLIHLSLHSKIVLVVSAALLLTGTVLFALLEWSNPETYGAFSLPGKLSGAFFQSATLRTAGFSILDINLFTEASQFLFGIFMVIGGSPASTAGGMKTVTLGVIVFAILSLLRGRGRIEAFGRAIPMNLLQKALTIACLILFVILIAAILLQFTEQGNPYPHGFRDLLNETCAATSTTGMSSGITPYLSSMGKLIIIFCMFVGRLSPVTVVVALSMRPYGSAGISYPEERVIVG